MPLEIFDQAGWRHGDLTFARVTLLVKQNVATNPVNVGLLGAIGIVL